jgi:hypothetical protein
LRARDGWITVNLAREDDRLAAPAWIGCDLDAEPWAALEQAAAGEAGEALVARGQALGVPAAVVGACDDEQWRARWPGPAEAARVERLGEAGPPGAWTQAPAACRRPVGAVGRAAVRQPVHGRGGAGGQGGEPAPPRRRPLRAARLL